MDSLPGQDFLKPSLQSEALPSHWPSRCQTYIMVYRLSMAISAPIPFILHRLFPNKSLIHLIPSWCLLLGGALHTETELGPVTCFSQWNDSKCDTSRRQDIVNNNGFSLGQGKLEILWSVEVEMSSSQLEGNSETQKTILSWKVISIWVMAQAKGGEKIPLEECIS